MRDEADWILSWLESRAYEVNNLMDPEDFPERYVRGYQDGFNEAYQLAKDAMDACKREKAIR